MTGRTALVTGATGELGLVLRSASLSKGFQ